MSSLVAMVSVTVPLVMMVGRQGASRFSEGLLRALPSSFFAVFVFSTLPSTSDFFTCAEAFSFLMTLAISMQLSVCVIFLLDDGTLGDAYIDSCESTVHEICQSDYYRVWQIALPVSKRSLADACSCIVDGDGSQVGADGFASCVREIADAHVEGAADTEGVGAKTVATATICFTLAVEVLMSYT